MPSRFYFALTLIGSGYLLLIAAMLVADLFATSPSSFWHAFSTREVQNALTLSLLSATTTTMLSMLVGVPLGYVFARTQFWGRGLLELLVDIPLVLPPLVVGLSLLLLMRTSFGQAVQEVFPLVYEPAGVVLAQFAVCGAFAIRTMRNTFEQNSPRTEQVALTLGCSRWQAFRLIALPEAARGLAAAMTLTWARAFGEFGPVLVFAGITRNRTEVLPTTIYLELSVGHTETAVAVALVMVGISAGVLLLVRGLTPDVRP
jgi:molybdate transport system permease protein